MPNIRERRRKPGQKRREKTSIDGGYSDQKTREQQNIRSSHMTDADGRSLVSKEAGEYFKHRYASIGSKDQKNERFLWLDRMTDVGPVFETDRQALLQMIDDLGIYLAATVFNNAPQMWEKTYLNGMLASLRHNIELLEIGAYPPVFFPSVHRSPVLATRELFKGQVEVALHYFDQACATNGEAKKLIVDALKPWKITGFSWDKVRRMEPEDDFAKIRASLFIQLLPPDYRQGENLGSSAIPHLWHALNLMADSYKKRGEAIKKKKETARGSRYSEQFIAEISDRYRVN